MNVDMRRLESVDLAVDLNRVPWPWITDSVDHVFAADCLEHLFPLGVDAGQRNIIAVLGEIYRVLKPGGSAELIVPSTDGPGAWQDPTHVTYWNRNTFLYFVQHSEIRPATASEGWPEFTIEDRDCGIADTVANELGIIWTVAKMKKPGKLDG